MFRAHNKRNTAKMTTTIETKVEMKKVENLIIMKDISPAQTFEKLRRG